MKKAAREEAFRQKPFILNYSEAISPLPLSIARGWQYLGGEGLFLPAVTAFLFTFLTLGLLWSALCLLRALGYEASVSSSFVDNPLPIKEEVCQKALVRATAEGHTNPLDLVRALGDPMMPVAAGIAKSYAGTLVFAGGTQMLAVRAWA